MTLPSVEEYQQRWEKHWEADLKPGEKFDAARSPPSLVKLLERDVVPIKGARAFVPGCGRGYDLITLLQAGASEVIGLELAPTATVAATKYIAEQPVDPALCRVVTGDFFDWTDGHGFEVGFDYTFFCAMHPDMRQAWAEAWHRHLVPGGRLITLIFPTDPSVDPGPPWYIHPDMCKELLLPLGFELELLEKVPDELSHQGRKGMETMAVWCRAESSSCRDF